MPDKKKRKQMNGFLYLTKVPKFGVAIARSVTNSTMTAIAAITIGQSIFGLYLMAIRIDRTIMIPMIPFSN